MTTHSSPTSHLDAGTSSEALTASQFHILLTLAEGSCHGYGIMKKVEDRTDGLVELGPGTLYRSINQLLARGFIVELADATESEGGRPRREYALTPAGKRRATEEARQLRALLRWADEAIGLGEARP